MIAAVAYPDLYKALSRQESQEVFDDTSGIIFLGTPHQGSSVSAAGAALASMTAFLGSSPSLLFSLASHDSQLSDLTVRFSACVALTERRQQPFNIREFYETKPTYLLGWFPIGLVCPSRVELSVNLTSRRSSPGIPPLPIPPGLLSPFPPTTRDSTNAPEKTTNYTKSSYARYVT